MATNNNEVDYFYLTFPINYSGTNTNGATPATAQFNQSAPYVDRQQDYYLACTRLEINGFTVPLWIAQMRVGTDYANAQLIYSFTLTYKTFSSSQKYIVWIPSDLSFQPATGTIQVSLQSTKPYYWVYTFDQIFNMFNASLADAFNELSIASGGTLPVGALAPKVYFDGARGSSLIQVQTANYSSLIANPIKLYMNNEMSTLFANYTYNSLVNNDANGKDNLFIFTPGFHTTDSVDNTMSNFYPFTFNPKNFVSVNGFTVNSNLAIQFESVQPPNMNYGQTSLMQSSDYSIIPSDNILHSFIPDYSILQNVGSDFIYSKSETWDFIQILGSGPINQFQFSIYFTTYSGEKVPLYLLPTSSCSIKLGFFKKSLFNSRSKDILITLSEEVNRSTQVVNELKKFGK